MTRRLRLAPAVILLCISTMGIGTGIAVAQDDDSLTTNVNAILDRPDIKNLPPPLKARILELAKRPHTYNPMRAFSEAPTPSQLFGYYLLDTTGFEPNVFTARIPEINGGVIPTAANCANRGKPTIAAVRLTLEPKPGLPTDPNDPGSFNDFFTDISGLFVINNESGWYEGWQLHDVIVPVVAMPRPDGHAKFGKITQADADALNKMGNGHNVPGRIFTTDGTNVRFPSASDHFPDHQGNTVPVALSMGAFNCLQQADCHSYWEFNEYTDWVFPAYELPFTGGLGSSFADGRVAFLTSVVPGSGPAGTGPTGPGPTGGNDPRVYGDNPNDPRDPDRLQENSLDDLDCPEEGDEEHKEFRLRFVPSNLGNEIFLDVYVRVKSFFPNTTDLNERIFKAYAAEVARVDQDGDGVISGEEGDLEGTSDGQSNERLFIPATQWNRFAVTRELNDGLLAPRFGPSQRAWVLSGNFVRVDPPVDASIPQDFDNR
ncbi:MAG: hypothetical protein ABI968_14175 [Acidobacteriota bacterium]